MHRYAEGTLGNVEKPVKFLKQMNIAHASPCRGHPGKC